LEDEVIREDVVWCVWVRAGYEPDGEWLAIESSAGVTRADSIRKFEENITINWYRRHREKGLAKCVRSYMVPLNPDDLNGN
jgi:hypothetical protein